METGTVRPAALAAEVFPAGDPIAALAGLPGAFALRSSLPDRGAPERRARWSYFGADPFASFRGGAPRFGALPSRAIAAFRALAATAGPNEAARELGAPFAGGAGGYWASDYGRRLEGLVEAGGHVVGLPDDVLAFHDVVVARDEDSGRAWVFSSG